MIYQDAEMLGDYLGDKLMAEPHRDKQIIIAVSKYKRGIFWIA